MKLREQNGLLFDEHNNLVTDARGQAIPARRLQAGQLGTPRQPPAATHRAGHHSGLHPEDSPHWTDTQLQDTRNTNAPRKTTTGQSRKSAQANTPAEQDPYAALEGEYDILVPSIPKSQLRYDTRPSQVITQGRNRAYVFNQPLPTQATRKQTQAPVDDEEDLDDTDPYGNTSPPRRWRFGNRGMRLVYWGIILCIIMTAGWIVLSLLGSWLQTTMDDWHYGRPRTFQIDAVVGHGDSASNPSHFIALNLQGRVIIIEIPGGDASKSRIYQGPYIVGNGDELTPITLSFKDVTGNGLLDMEIHDQSTTFLYINEKGTFRPEKPEEHYKP